MDTYKVQFPIQELEGQVVTPMPKDIADHFQIPYIKISDIEKWSNKEYKLPKEFNKYYPRTEDIDAEGAEEAKVSSASEVLEIQAGPWVAAMIPKILPVPYGYKIVTVDIDKAEVLESVSRISIAADVWARCIKILKRNNWNSFVYLKKNKKRGSRLPARRLRNESTLQGNRSGSGATQSQS